VSITGKVSDKSMKRCDQYIWHEANHILNRLHEVLPQNETLTDISITGKAAFA